MRKLRLLLIDIPLLFTAYYPALIAVIFAVVFIVTPIPAKLLFLARALAALVISVFLAHFNRIFEVWPAHLLFPSGHTTFCAGMAWSLAMLRPWTLLFTIPLLIAMGTGLVLLHFHSWFDVVGAFPLVLLVYGLIHTWWKLPGEVGSVLI